MIERELLEEFVDRLVVLENFQDELSLDRKIELLSLVLDQLRYERGKDSETVTFEEYLQSEVKVVGNRLLISAPSVLRDVGSGLMLQQGESLIYVQRKLGHASINLTADTYGKWLPLGNKTAVDRLDATILSESGSKMVAMREGEAEETSEVVGKFGGACRGRTYGPLMKSQPPVVSPLSVP